MNSSASPIHHAAATGFTSGAENYVKGRPDYPREATSWLRDQLGLGTGLTVVDLGAGTGKFTPRLLETGAKVIAVEPVAAMLAKLSAALPQVQTLTGTAEAIPLPDNSVDALVCAQSFHWFANQKAMTEIHRVLKTGDKFGLIWNARDESGGWVRELGEIINRHEGDAPRYAKGTWREVFPFLGFGPLHEEHFSHGHTGALEDVIINRALSTSFIAALPAEEREALVNELKALIAKEPELRDKDTVTVPYASAAFYTVKL